jgi:hypothetical protein
VPELTLYMRENSFRAGYVASGIRGIYVEENNQKR